MSDDEDADASEEAETDASGGDAVPVGVKLGSTRTVIALPDSHGTENRIIKTLTCMATYEDALTGEEKILYGEEAAREYPDRVEYMLRSGLPEDKDRAEMTKTFFEALIEENDIPANSGVVYAIPTIDNPAGLENLKSVIEDSGIGIDLMESYPESLCGSIPAFGDDLEAIDEIFISVNMGSTNLEASAYRRGEQLAPRRRPKAGSTSTPRPPGSTRRNTPTSSTSSPLPTSSSSPVAAPTSSPSSAR